MATSSKESWTTIESDPGVFTELLQRMGVQSIQVEELYSLEDNLLQSLSPVYGLIFLFKWRAEKDDRPIDYKALKSVWFANQVIQNACATQAILSILFNRPEVELGMELTNLKNFTADFPPKLKGLTIGNSDVIRTAHNSFRAPQAFIPDDEDTSEQDSSEVYHFIGYVPVDGVLYELDGLKEGPIRLCNCQEDDWLTLVSPFIRSRIEQYAKHEIRFNLMAVIKNRTQVLEKQIAEETEREEQLTIAVADSSMTDAQREQSNKEMAQLGDSIARCQQDLKAEEAKHLRWKKENVRRKHNYIPFLFNFLKVLAEKDQLKELIEIAKEKQRNEQEEKEEESNRNKTKQ